MIPQPFPNSALSPFPRFPECQGKGKPLTLSLLSPPLPLPFYPFSSTHATHSTPPTPTLLIPPNPPPFQSASSPLDAHPAQALTPSQSFMRAPQLLSVALKALRGSRGHQPLLIPLFSTVVPFAAYIDSCPSILSPLLDVMFVRHHGRDEPPAARCHPTSESPFAPPPRHTHTHLWARSSLYSQHI